MTASAPKLNAFPVFIRVADEVVVIVGGGDEAFAKARLIGQSSAKLRIVAEEVETSFAAWIAQNSAEHIAEAYTAHHLDSARLVFAASGGEVLDRQVSEDARLLGIAVNAVDRPELCDFYTPAIVNRAPVCIAIGTEGTGPVLSQMLRARIDRMLAPSLGALASLGETFRASVERFVPKGSARRRFWSDFFAGEPARQMEIGHIEEARAAATELLLRRQGITGHVSLVGAGPGAEDLLTLRAQRHLMEADVIVHDVNVPETLVAMGRRDAERVAVGKHCDAATQRDINDLLVKLATEGKRVVRLKLGDLLMFGKAGDEIAALRAAAVSYELVPGVVAPFASVSKPARQNVLGEAA
ncbi:uroporphyrinogen-III C-methyltransferase [Mesorhizobium denitrificans]|uniref:Uroporphyrinogen-III C-methyltransferase n=1 Tax=Mesorhizobium denitrificans TaxID=2294114 RepID=A0A371XJ78_9HYPH|nr:uroporphyrinogen-III C-methyltransferase [Mesorhizobium denitrificans]